MEPPFDRMTIAERILYVQALWDRIAADAEQEPLTPAQGIELDRRLADYRAHPETSISWDLAREQMRRRD
jgi:putative addiction module component (TIGR02574 family)